jgi:ABC-type oligopeptide transport system ATPase subunit
VSDSATIDSVKTTEHGAGSARILLDGVTKSYDAKSTPAVDNITMEIPAGEIAMLVGPSGCGKTTTMKMINRLIEPTSGRILIGDDDVTHRDPDQLRRHIDRSDLTFCVESEFASRNDGFVPMLQAYGLTRDALGRITHLDTGVIYTATANGDCNFGEVFTTDGRIPALNLRVLKDDKQFFPLYNLTEVIETDLLTAHPELADIIAQLNPKLTNETMMALNAKVDTDGDDPALVARDWLIQQGLLT